MKNQKEKNIPHYSKHTTSKNNITPQNLRSRTRHARIHTQGSHKYIYMHLIFHILCPVNFNNMKNSLKSREIIFSREND